MIADGGITSSGDVAKAIAAGADSVMLGGMLAGTDESPGDVISRTASGTRSTAAWARSARCKRGAIGRTVTSRATSRTSRSSSQKESKDGCLKGPLTGVLHQVVGGLRQAMGYCGAPTIDAMKQARFVRITGAGLRESHPHDITITKDAPNYRRG